jgi:hypothetical protein
VGALDPNRQEDIDMAPANPPHTRVLPMLENGDQLDQKTFHARYQAMPEDCRAELIGGIVYMSSPQNVPHSKAHRLVVRWLDEYTEATPRTDALMNNTQILGFVTKLAKQASR